jgi:DNA-binding transcriptional regulator LsrR (DeoR family)
MCGAFKTDNGIDPVQKYSAADVIRRLAFIADKTPALALLLIYYIAGRTEREIAAKIHKSQPAIHEQIAKARAIVLSICE